MVPPNPSMYENTPHLLTTHTVPSFYKTYICISTVHLWVHVQTCMKKRDSYHVGMYILYLPLFRRPCHVGLRKKKRKVRNMVMSLPSHLSALGLGMRLTFLGIVTTHPRLLYKRSNSPLQIPPSLVEAISEDNHNPPLRHAALGGQN